MFVASYPWTTGSLADPAGSSVLAAAVSWLEATLLGTVATTIAVIAVSWVGLMMLAGRVNVRHGLTVIAGGFILFGASTIAGGLRSLAVADLEAAQFAPQPPVSAPPPALPPPPPANHDPYAGASVPTR